MLTESLRFHQVTRTEEGWVNLVLDGVESLTLSSLDRHGAQAVHQLILNGPVGDARVQKVLRATKHTNSVRDCLLVRLEALKPAELTKTTIMVSAVSRLVVAMSPFGQASHDQLVQATEGALAHITTGSNPNQGRADVDDAAIDRGLASLLCVGRQASVGVKQRLEKVYDLPPTSRLSSCTPDLIRETVCACPHENRRMGARLTSQGFLAFEASA